MPHLKMTLFAVALVAAAVWGFYSAGLKSERDRLAAELAEASRLSAALERELMSGRLALERREAERRKLADEKDALIQRLQEVYDNDEKAGAWAVAPCPDGVLDCLLGQVPADAAD